MSMPMSTTILPCLFPEFPSLSSIYWTGLSKRRPVPLASPPLLVLPKTLNPRSRCHANVRAISNPFPLSSSSSSTTTTQKHCVLNLLIKPVPSSTSAVSAGRSKKNSGPGPGQGQGQGQGRIEGSGEIRRQAKENARRRSRRLSENLFYRRNSPSSLKHGDSFTEEELQMIGLGYDRYVRFMSKDDPNLRHPYDWYKYGRYGPYSWRGIVVGNPIRGRFSDERVTLYGEVRDDEEWEEIERYDMAADFSRRLESLDPSSIGLRHYWVFVRHPKWRPTELPWQQWTLVSEVVIEAGKDHRLDKWSLMGRLGSKTRSMITQCAAWMRPDIIYVKRPVYQCRFEPQDDFFKLLGPLLDPTTEKEYPCELKLEDEEGTVCTYFGGLCKIVKISPKAYVDDVVNAYQKLSDEGKSKCLEFLLTNHPMELLHPYTKEWKAKLEEMELGCDAPDDSEDDSQGETQITDWIEDSDESGADDDDEEEEDEDDVVIDLGRGGKEGEELGTEVDDANPEESEEYWNEQWNKALSSSEAMENFVKKSVQVSSEFYKKQMMEQEQIKQRNEEGGSSGTISVNQESREKWRSMGNRAPRREVNKSKKPPELFLRAAVRPFTYRNLVKEIVLMRHAIIDGDISVSN